MLLIYLLYEQKGRDKMLKAIKNAYNKYWAEEEIGGKIAFFSAGLSMGALFLFLLSVQP